MSTDTPAQWRMVPVEPTDEMLDAAASASMQHLLDCIKDPKLAKEIGSEVMVRKTHASRYRSMLAASPQPTAAQPLTDEQIDAIALHTVYDGDDTCAYRDSWCREVGRPFARAIERAHGIGASAAPTQAVAELVEALNNLLEAVESMQCTYGCVRGDTPEDADTFTHDEWAEKFLQERANAAVAALSRAPGAGMPDDRIQPGAVAPRLE